MESTLSQYDELNEIKYFLLDLKNVYQIGHRLNQNVVDIDIGFQIDMLIQHIDHYLNNHIRNGNIELIQDKVTQITNLFYVDSDDFRLIKNKISTVNNENHKLFEDLDFRNYWAVYKSIYPDKILQSLNLFSSLNDFIVIYSEINAVKNDLKNLDKDEMAKKASELYRLNKDFMEGTTIAHYGSIFKTISKKHKRHARWWLGSIVILIVLGAIIIACQLAGLNDLIGDNQEILANLPFTWVLWLLYRLSFFTILIIAIQFCIKNYRSCMHIKIVNVQRQTTLNTYNNLMAVSSDNKRDSAIILNRIVDTIFSHQSTGYEQADKNEASNKQLLEILKAILNSKN